MYSFLNRLSVREMDDHDPMIALYARADRVWNAPVIHVGMVPRELESIAIDLDEEGALGKAAHRETRPNQDGDGGSRATAKREPVRSEASLYAGGGHWLDLATTAPAASDRCPVRGGKSRKWKPPLQVEERKGGSAIQLLPLGWRNGIADAKRSIPSDVPQYGIVARTIVKAWLAAE